MITSASIVGVFPQKDGRSYVIEQQIDDTSGPELFVYLAAAGTDSNAVMVARTAAINAALAALPSVTITQDDGTTLTFQSDQLASISLQLTATQKSQLQNAKQVIDAVRPLVKAYYNRLTQAQQQFVVTHSPWFAQALAILS